jgi:hypothetical protein
MAELRSMGISPLVELTFSNAAYDGGNTPYTENGFRAYAHYGVELLRHYGTQISAVEIWNEYNGSFCSGPAASDRAGTYARMERIAYEALKAERPDIVVAGGATAGIPMPYLERLFADGALDSMDAVSVHPYRTDSEPEGIEKEISALQELIKRFNHGRPKPIWVTEIGWGTRGASDSGDPAINEETQASFLIRAYTLLLSAGVERIYWYLFRDYSQFATMGLVRADKRETPKPAYMAMKTMIAEIGAAHFVRRERTKSDFYSLLFDRDAGGQVRVIWSLRPDKLNLTASCKAVGMLGGDVASGVPLAIGTEPVFVEGSLSNLPSEDANPPRIIADSQEGFSDSQGLHGWSYGILVGDSTDFKTLKDFRTTDWKREWFSSCPFLSFTDTEQHPSEMGAEPVAAVRRWTCEGGGRLRIFARFRCGPKGDGVKVRVLVNGREAFADVIGGVHHGTAQFESVQDLPPGSSIDFAVFPGSRGNADFDATEISARIIEN